DQKDLILKNASWSYTTAEDVLREINGRALRDLPASGLKSGDLVRKISDLQPDGSTSSGAWIYAGVFGGGVNLSKRRDSRPKPGVVGRLLADACEVLDAKGPAVRRDVAYVPKDGALPEMSDPVEGPVENILHPKVNHNPLLKYPRVQGYQPIGTVAEFPYVLM